MAPRVTLNFMSLPVDGRWIFSSKVEPASPRKWLLTYSLSFFVMSSPSMESMMSPFFNPAFAAGMFS